MVATLKKQSFVLPCVLYTNFVTCLPSRICHKFVTLPPATDFDAVQNKQLSLSTVIQSMFGSICSALEQELSELGLQFKH